MTPAVLQHLGLSAEQVRDAIARNPAPPKPKRRVQSATERNRILHKPRAKSPPLLAACRALFDELPAASNSEVALQVASLHHDYATCCPKWLRYTVKNCRSQLKRSAAKRAAKGILTAG